MYIFRSVILKCREYKTYLTMGRVYTIGFYDLKFYPAVLKLAESMIVTVIPFSERKGFRRLKSD
jgi:hypothetical protein